MRGREGVARAKRWLDGTTRARVEWTVYDAGAAPKLTVDVPGVGEVGSFDMGGLLKDGAIHNQQFWAEVKFYDKSSGDLTAEYRKFLVLCYRALETHQALYDEFMFITWVPFAVTTWHELTTVKYVTSCVESALGSAVAADSDLCARVSERLTIIVLSERQERLAATDQVLALIAAERVRGGG